MRKNVFFFFFFTFGWYSLRFRWCVQRPATIFHECNELSNFISCDECVVCTLCCVAWLMHWQRRTKGKQKNKWNLRTREAQEAREASGIKIQATNDHIHSNRYLLISGFITARQWEGPTTDTVSYHFHLRTCRSSSRTHSYKRARARSYIAQLTSSRCEFDNYYYYFFDFVSCASIAITMKFNTPVYRYIYEIKKIKNSPVQLMNAQCRWTIAILSGNADGPHTRQTNKNMKINELKFVAFGNRKYSFIFQFWKCRLVCWLAPSSRNR